MNRYIKRYDSENHEMTYLTDIAGVDIIVSKDIIIDEYLKEIERLNNIIDELEKWLNIQITCSSTQDYGVYKISLDKLKELKKVED